jgi:hypothetical protein
MAMATPTPRRVATSRQRPVSATDVDVPSKRTTATVIAVAKML